MPHGNTAQAPRAAQGTAARHLQGDLARAFGRYPSYTGRLHLPRRALGPAHRGRPVITDPLALIRAAHFAATLLASGTVFFAAFVIGPTRLPQNFPILRTHMNMLVWAGLALSVLTGAMWLVWLAANILGESLAEVCLHGGAWSVLADTRFGWICCRAIGACGSSWTPRSRPGAARLANCCRGCVPRSARFREPCRRNTGPAGRCPCRLRRGPSTLSWWLAWRAARIRVAALDRPPATKAGLV